MPKREITVGVTVNLKNYESLRIEVEDDVESEEDVRSLIAFLDQTLALFGRGNAETEELITHYRKRVLKGAIDDGSGVPVPAPAAPKTVAMKPVRTPKAETDAEPPAPEPATPEPLAAEAPPEAPPAQKPAAKPPAKPPARAPAPSPTGAVCEECGAAVSAAEEKTSRLFVSRVLCKKCIQSL